MPRHPTLLLALALLLFPGLRAADAPTLHRGTLPNGLDYIILPHASAKGDISLRLVVQAGSLDERDDERGFAHFVEHMAFNGTRRFPPGRVRAFFQRLGLTFGADLNANTSFTHTTYILDLPEGRGDHLGEALDLLRDYADGLLFLPEEVKAEAGVVISELNARDGAGRRLANQMLDLLYAGTPAPDREVAGLPGQLAAATPEKLKAFYQRNYRPDRMTLVIVGPVEPAAIVEKITVQFSALTPAPDSLPPAAVVAPPSFGSVRAAFLPAPTAKGVTVSFITVAPRPPDTPEGRRQAVLQRLAISALNARLQKRRDADVTRFGQMRVALDPSFLARFAHPMLSVGTPSGSWDDGVQLLETELRRARTEGFSQVEIDEAATAHLASLRQHGLAGRPSATLATEIARDLAAGRTWQLPGRDLAEAAPWLNAVAAEEVDAALDELFPSDSLHLVLIAAPENPVKPERILAALAKSSSRPLRQSAATEGELVFRYEQFGPPGTVAKRERVEDLDLTLATFVNDVRLNIRPSSLEPGRFRLRIVFPVNYAHLQPSQGGIAELAGQLLLNSNLKRHKLSELSRLLKLHSVTPQFSVNQGGTPVLGINGPVSELGFALRFLTALLSDLALDQDHYRAALSRYGGQVQRLYTTPAPLALREAMAVYAGQDARLRWMPMRAFASNDRQEEVESWLDTYILSAPLEIGLVGDLAVEHTLALAAETVGTLKRRRGPPKVGFPLASPQKAVRHEGVAKLPASTSMSCVLWPVELDDDPRHNAALTLAADILHDRLIIVLREALGATYSPLTRVHRDSLQRDFAFIAMTNTFDPAQARKLTEGSVRFAARLAQEGVPPAEFERLREPLRARYADDLRNNTWWLNTVVCLAQAQPRVIEEARHHARVVEELTIEDVNRAVATFKPDRVTAMIIRPAEAGIPEEKSGK